MRTLVAKTKRKILFGRNRRKWEDNIKIGPKIIVRDAAHRIYVAQDRDQCWAVVNTVMNLLVPASNY
jgi:hypothetical protein